MAQIFMLYKTKKKKSHSGFLTINVRRHDENSEAKLGDRKGVVKMHLLQKIRLKKMLWVWNERKREKIEAINS